jgi:anion-transporting  ArsA/GET3 family ATPase
LIRFDRRLLIVSGKGGVGKSTLVTALGLLAAERGIETLICEMGENEKIAPQFGRRASSYCETPLGVPHLSSIYLDPQESFNDYVRSTLKFETLWRPVVESSLIKAFIQAGPGFKELMTLNKLVELERAVKPNGTPKYDLILLDAPATGHGLTLFRSPMLVMRGAKAGPIFQKARLIAELLQDEQRTRMHIVTLAEEMPVSETLDMVSAIRFDVHIPLGDIVVNAVVPATFAPEQAEVLAGLRRAAQTVAIDQGWGDVRLLDMLAAADQLEGRSRLNAEHIARLKAKANIDTVTLPFIFDVPWTLASVRKVGGHLA